MKVSRKREPYASTKQDAMKQKILLRNKKLNYPHGDQSAFYKCDICGDETSDAKNCFINAHVIAWKHRDSLATARSQPASVGLPPSPFFVANGLLLCRSCDNHYEYHRLIVDEAGVIKVARGTTPSHKYPPLHLTKVAWANLIDKDVSWPTSETLRFQQTLAPVFMPTNQPVFEDSSSEVSPCQKPYFIVSLSW